MGAAPSRSDKRSMSGRAIGEPFPVPGSLRRRTFLLLSAADEHGWSRVIDSSLATLILLNVVASVLESVSSLRLRYAPFFDGFELVSVVIFTGEYLLRLWSCVEKEDDRFHDPVRGRLRYACTLMALVDLAAVLPFYLGALLQLDLRFLRALRIIRFLKLTHYFSGLEVLLDALRAERPALEAAFFLLMIAVLLASSGIYLFEHEAQPEDFASIPAAMWWALVTLTTVGYGDVTPVTVGGKIFGACITIVGVGMVALPTGILATGFAAEMRRRRALFADAATMVMADGRVDPQEEVYLEEVRVGLGLSREGVVDLDPSQPGGPEVAPRCPHCGGAFRGEAPKA